MSSEATVKEVSTLKVEVLFGLGLSGAVSEFVLNLKDPDDVARKITSITELVKLPLVGKINELSQVNESLRKRVLSNDEIQHIAHLVKTHPTEIRHDGRETNDDLLVKKLEGMLKS
jgi:hypothetical protein